MDVPITGRESLHPKSPEISETVSKTGIRARLRH